MQQDTRIAVVHAGRGWYLPYTLSQAKFVSPESEVVFIGDTPAVARLIGVAKEPMDSLGAKVFENQYQHRHRRSPKIELISWLRWFYLLEYMRRKEADSVLYLDSDVLLFSSMSTLVDVYGEAVSDCGLEIPKQDHESHNWLASGGVSYWTRAALEDFCEFALESFSDSTYVSLYEQKWDWAQRTGLTSRMGGAGVSDMTTLYLWWWERRADVFNFSQDYRGNVIDHSFQVSMNHLQDEYEVDENGMKRHEWIDGELFFVKANSSRDRVRAHACHFSGGAKPLIRELYSGPRPFRGQAYADVQHWLGRTRRSTERILRRA